MSDDKKFPSQIAERFQVRMPDGLRDRIRDAAERNGRSMNTEIVSRLEESFIEQSEIQRAADSLASAGIGVVEMARAFGALLDKLKDSPEARQALIEMARQSQSQK